MNPIVHTLLVWYRRHGRNLPWRHTRNPYRIFISEIMLQQTQVDRVVSKYNDWIKKFKTWRALAEATTPELINQWAGLGYNRRALYVREAARHVVTHGLPTTPEEWKSLKGVGPYAAAALTEFVNHKRAIVIDTNIRRVIGRLFLGKPFPELKDDNRITDILGQITPLRGAHWDFPQASMDFANAVCLPRSPRCGACPLRDRCRSAKKFLANPSLQKTARRSLERIHAEKPFPDRIYRGRILAWIRLHGPTSIQTLGVHVDPTFDVITDSDWVRAMIDRLAADGLLHIGSRAIVSLPNS